MWASLELHGYRAWSELTLDGLARVNVLVGRNGAGKTTVLEAVEALSSRTLAGLFASSTRREEAVYVANAGGTFTAATSFARIFHGRRAEAGQRFRVLAKSATGVASTVTVQLESPQPQLLPGEVFDASIGSVATALWTPDGPSVNVGLSADGIVRSQVVSAGRTLTAPPLRYVTSRSLTPQGAAQALAPLTGTPKEDRILQALQIVAPEVERIVVGSSGAPIFGVFARLSGLDDRVPIGSLGDGATRMLVMASELANASGGVLLVDEIESGLHVSVMAAMWRMLIQTAVDADVQIFATTHSDDCLRGLATLFDDEASASDRALAPEVCAYRMDRGIAKATRYSAENIHAALASGMEIRG